MTALRETALAAIAARLTTQIPTATVERARRAAVDVDKEPLPRLVLTGTDWGTLDALDQLDDAPKAGEYVIAAEKPCLQQMIEAYAQTGGNMVAAMEVPPEKASSYGVLDIGEDMGSIVQAKGMVEKPKAEDAPSNLAVIGRYILSPQVLTNLNRMKSGAGGEIQLTDAIAEEVASGKVYGYRFRGQRYDCGSKAGFLQATVAFGMARPDLRDEFTGYLHDVIAQQKAAQ